MFLMHRLDFAQAQQFMQQTTAPTAYQALAWAHALQHVGAAYGQWWGIYTAQQLCAVFFLGQQRRYGVWPSFYLNRTGRRPLDVVTTEYNQLWLSDYAHQHNLAPALRQALPLLIKQQHRNMCTLWLDYIPAHHAADYGACGWQQHIYKQLPTWGIPLSPEGDVLAVASSNIRTPLRRSMRQLSLQLHSASCAMVALDWFYKLFTLNNQRHNNGVAHDWHRSFLRFHTALLQHGTPNIDYDVLQITHNNMVVGYLYHLLTPQQALYYMGGFNYHDFGQHKAGLLCHVLAAQHHAQHGRTWYDFLAGDYRYKRQMGVDGTAMVSMIVQPNTWRARAYNALKYSVEYFKQ